MNGSQQGYVCDSLFGDSGIWSIYSVDDNEAFCMALYCCDRRELIAGTMRVWTSLAVWKSFGAVSGRLANLCFGYSLKGFNNSGCIAIINAGVRYNATMSKAQ